MTVPLISSRKFMDQHRNMEVMKTGYLKKNMSTNKYKKQYKKFYFILKRDIENSSKKTLEYFKNENSSVKKKPKGVCNLYSQYNIHIKLKKERKFIFEIVGVDKSHELMTTDETTGKEWVDLLTEGLVIQIFSIIKMHYPPLAQNYVKDMKGTVLLKSDQSCVTLLSNNGPAISWEFSVIRKCKMNNGLVILEVAKNSITGEGEYYFDTSHPKHLYDVLDRAVRERAKKKEIVPNTNATGNYPLIQKRLNSPQIDNKYDTDETNKTGKMEPNDLTYDHLSHVPDLAEPSTSPPRCKNTYDFLFSSTKMVTQQRSDSQATTFLSNTELLSGKTKITLAVVNNHDTKKNYKTENIEPNDSTYDHLSHVPGHLAKPSTPPPSCKNTNDSLLCATRMVAQKRTDPQVVPFLNNAKLSNSKTKITSSTVNNHDTNNTNKAGNRELNDSNYDHLSHVPNHLAKPSTPPSSGNTCDSLFSPTKMIIQQKSDPPIAPFLNNTKLLSCKALTSSAVAPSATPTILESIYVQMDLYQTNEFQKPIPPSLRSKPTTSLRSIGLSLDSVMDLNDKPPVRKFINPTLRSKEESPGGLNTKFTYTFENGICDDTNNMYEVLKEHSKLSSNNNEENRNSSSNEYSHLFEHPPKEASNQLSDYNHLLRNPQPKPLPRTNKLGLQISPMPPFKNKKKPLRPVRPLSLQQPVYEIPRTK